MIAHKTLTGNTRYRTNLFGKLILQVEVSQCDYDYQPCGDVSPYYKIWRDAKTTDISFEVQNELKK